jgi:hypothetical protein
VPKRQRSASRRIPRARRLQRSPLSRTDVTRAEYNRIIDILNERNIILNALREGLQRLEHAGGIQFTRIAELQADVDALKRRLDRG